MTLVVSKAVFQGFHRPLAKFHLPSVLQGGGVLVGLEFGVVV